MNSVKGPSQQERILKVLEALRDGKLDVPEEYIRRHLDGDGVSGRYFKHVMMISECNARISELNTKHKTALGTELIETSGVKDAHGFAYHRLKPAVTVAELNRRALEWFDALP